MKRNILKMKYKQKELLYIQVKCHELDLSSASASVSLAAAASKSADGISGPMTLQESASRASQNMYKVKSNRHTHM